MARSDAEHLEALKTQRDALVDQLSEVSAYNVGSRGAKREKLAEQLRVCNEMIQQCETRIAVTTSGPTRNLAKLTKRP